MNRAGSARDFDVRLLSLSSAAGRIAIGAGLAVAPKQVLRMLGFDETPASAIVIARVAASRDLVLGVATLAALNDDRGLRRASLANAAADAGDALTFLSALRTRSGREAGARGVAAAIPATAAGLWVAARLRRA